ncbi:MAG: hypothetical protein EOP51_34690, partial [Sphingobacteriales bacterium]
YSPVHQDAAVCCVPNAGRIAPYYVQNMWMKSRDTLVAALLGPCEVNTTINGKAVLIKEVTQYPFNNTISFEITAATSFNLKIRKPDWATNITVSTKYYQRDGFIVFSKKPAGKYTIKIDLNPVVKVQMDNNDENSVYFTYGALVLAHPIAATETKTKEFPLPGFFDYRYTPEKLVVYEYDNQDVFKYPGKLIFDTQLYNPNTKQMEKINLQPMESTILRQVSFKFRER